jgi:hypothetical protein
MHWAARDSCQRDIARDSCCSNTRSISWIIISSVYYFVKQHSLTYPIYFPFVYTRLLCIDRWPFSL